MHLTSLKELTANIPSHVKLFLKRSSVVFIFWKLLYHLLLFPLKVPDQPLTHITSTCTAFVYNIISPNHFVQSVQEFEGGGEKSVIHINNHKVIRVADACNGLELFILYLGFIICLPTTFKRQLIFSSLGILLIFVLNIFRCYGLAWLYYHNFYFANFAHHYLFKMIIYVIIFYLWVKYANSKSYAF